MGSLEFGVTVAERKVKAIFHTPTRWHNRNRLRQYCKESIVLDLNEVRMFVQVVRAPKLCRGPRVDWECLPIP